ncbi:hypothetical protein DPMN_035997 [Dreissena polymorpha]|uniref:Uncharacterized protein n=1 Tax=Dreissena polymorpha TaxID=45954 RepID=A0A9D4RLJ7_DREPO|nr:hypothetical protein DPMN_035997 [Dreissena polymorpha]
MITIGKNVISRVFTSFFSYINIRKMTPPPWRPCFLPIRTIFELNHWTKNVTLRVFTCFHYIHIEKNCPAPWQPYINETNVLTEFHDDWAKIVTSRVFTRNTASPPGGHTKNLTKLHEDWASNVTSTVFTSMTQTNAINVASGMFTRQMLTTDNG